MSTKLVRVSLFLAGTMCCVAAALPYTLAQDKRLPAAPSRLLSAQEIANHDARARWTYTIELMDAESKRVLAEHDGSTPFDAPLTLAPPISTESLSYHLTVQQYRLDGDEVHLIIDIAHRLAPTSKIGARMNGNPKTAASRLLRNLEREPTSPSTTGFAMATIGNYNCLC